MYSIGCSIAKGIVNGNSIESITIKPAVAA